MKIATYNIWNSGSSDIRFDRLIREIISVNANVVALQEVTRGFHSAADKALARYPFSAFETYSDEDEGLAIFSKYPLDEVAFLHRQEAFGCSNALNVLFRADGMRFSLTNVHLPWDSIIAREAQTVAINSFIRSQRSSADFFILLGDFNCGPASSVCRFLEGECSLRGEEANPCWLDVAETYSVLSGATFPPTLDCKNNPRWKGKNTIYEPETCDRIYVMDNWNDFSFDHAAVFGTEPDPDTGLCPSDHYGVAAEITFSK